LFSEREFKIPKISKRGESFLANLVIAVPISLPLFLFSVSKYVGTLSHPQLIDTTEGNESSKVNVSKNPSFSVSSQKKEL
jgi:hypothetical protein